MTQNSLYAEEYTRDDHSFFEGEIVSGTFVQFDKCGHYNKVYALFDLDDGRKTRVDIKYFKRMKGREAMFLPGDRVTLQSRIYSTKHDQPSWFVRKTPMRLNNRKLKIDYPTPIQRLLSNDNWLELDSDFEQGATEQGKIVKFKSLHGKRRFAIVEFEDGAVTRVHRVSFEVANFSIDDFQVGDSLMVTKLGYMADRHTTKWIVVNPPYHFDEMGALVVQIPMEAQTLQYPDFIKERVYALYEATYWWHEYGKNYII